MRGTSFEKFPSNSLQELASNFLKLILFLLAHSISRFFENKREDAIMFRYAQLQVCLRKHCPSPTKIGENSSDTVLLKQRSNENYLGYRRTIFFR